MTAWYSICRKYKGAHTHTNTRTDTKKCAIGGLKVDSTVKMRVSILAEITALQFEPTQPDDAADRRSTPAAV